MTRRHVASLGAMDLLVNLYSGRLAELGKRVGAMAMEADSEDIYQGLLRVRPGQGAEA